MILNPGNCENRRFAAVFRVQQVDLPMLDTENRRRQTGARRPRSPGVVGEMSLDVIGTIVCRKPGWIVAVWLMVGRGRWLCSPPT